MAKLYKKVVLLVSRHYDHGGDGLEKGPIGFFRNIQEYDTLSAKHNWETDSSFKTCWWVRPTPIEAHVKQGVYQKWMNQSGKLSLDHVLFAADKLAQVQSVGGW